MRYLIYIYIYTCIHVYMYTCIDVYIYMYIYVAVCEVLRIDTVLCNDLLESDAITQFLKTKPFIMETQRLLATD